MAQFSRVPQAERRARTQSRLLDAAVACLADLGYAATTTVDVAHRAGVSRGAQQHHFRTKAELMAAAIDHAFTQRLGLFQAAATAADLEADPVGSAVDIIWSMFEEPVALAWIELTMASRTDSDLHQRVAAVSENMRAAIERQFRTLFPAAGADEVVYPVAAKLAFATFEGLALHRVAVFDDAPGRTEASLAGLKRMLQRALQPDASLRRDTR
jgi:AcrR family transcriptional regulator